MEERGIDAVRIIFKAPMLRKENTNEQRKKNTNAGTEKTKEKRMNTIVFFYPQINLPGFCEISVLFWREPRVKKGCPGG